MIRIRPCLALALIALATPLLARALDVPPGEPPVRSLPRAIGPGAVIGGVMGKAAAPDWLAVNPTLDLFHTQRGPARRAFARFVADGVNADDPYDASPKAGFLGTESFIETLLDKHDPTSVSSEIPKRLRPAHSLERIARHSADRDQAIAEAYRSGAYTLTEIARHFGIHLSTASRIARRKEDVRNKT